jgi:hypothetical protein
MTDLGYDQAMAVRTALMPVAYLLCTTGLLLSVFRHWGNFHEVLMSMVGIAVIVILLNGYPTALTTVADGFKTLREQTTAAAPGGNEPTWTQIFDAQFQQPSWNQVAEKIEIALCQMFKWIGKIAIWFLDWVQSWAFNGLIAISPILIGGLALQWTQGTGITFLTTSFGIAAWHLGIALVDILLASISTQLFAGVGIAGAISAATVVSVGLLPIFLGALVALVLVALCLYLAVPIVIAAVLRGGSPLTTAATSGMQMTLTALGLASMAGSRIAATASMPKGNSSLPGGGSEDDGGEQGSGIAPRPSMTPSGVGSSGSLTSSGFSQAESAPSSAERQSQILADHDSASPTPAGRRTRTERRVAEITLEHEEKAFI